MIGAGVRDSCGKSASRGDPAGESRGGSPTARGKRVPYVPINVQIVQAIKIDKLDFLHREQKCFLNIAFVEVILFKLFLCKRKLFGNIVIFHY
ncbi:hypothetical protein CQ056_04030 [Peribacillus simplex]|nr:hypothetical protein CQ056_04030 [Peribacillus simplex]